MGQGSGSIFSAVTDPDQQGQRGRSYTEAVRSHLAAAWFSLTQLGMGVNRCTSLAELELRPQVKVWAAPPGQPLTQAERVAENQDIRMGGGGGKQ